MFCILTAGRGTRLGDHTRSMNKALLPIKDKALISHIIEKVNCEIVVAVGYEADKVVEYCLAAHPDKKFIFVYVDNYDRPGSGPGYSLSRCKEHLQRPFVLTVVDCLVEEPYPEPSDWVGVAVTGTPELYCTFKVEDGFTGEMSNKKGEFNHAFIGICGIRSYEKFWERLKPGEEKEFELVNALWAMEARTFTWQDFGSNVGFDFSKENERTYSVNCRCVKVNPKAKSLIRRHDVLGGLVPELVYRGENVYAYDWIEGETLYHHTDKLRSFLDWCEEKLWVEKSHPDFKNWCYRFYHDKTYERVAQYKHQDSNFINGRECKDVYHYLDRMDWDELCDGRCVPFHGDLQFDNVIYDGDFHLIDWRDSFEGFDYGDMYYDLAKLYGGIKMPYVNIKKNLFTFNDKIEYNFQRLANEEELTRIMNVNKKIETLTAIIYLNMASLHKSPFDRLLFSHARWLLSHG